MRSILSIGVSVLLLVCTTSFRLSVHRCGGHVVSWSLVGDAEPCFHARARAHACPMHADAPVRGCCSDEAHIVEGLPLQVVPGAVLHVPEVVAPLLAMFVAAPTAPVLTGYRDAGPAHGKAPPLPGWEIHIRERSILI